ncbi:hypothetical protein [Nocardioides aquiterrae]|jgi:hypothetical protein|uniref:Uncharacterized protein n=1 Tax=Nocardioides aquiterrae TaxID=203799 RepID=A0ABN1U974_9ACTN
MRARAALFLLRHPMVAVTVVLALFAAAAFGASMAFSRNSPPAAPPPGGSDALVAPYTLPPPTESLSSTEVEPAHRALHALGRACKRTPARRDRGRVLQPLRVIENFASKHPHAGFTIDDESGTTLALLIVVRSELEACDPALLPRIDALIPSKYRS